MESNIIAGEDIRWNSLNEFFQTINTATKYLIIRNYEEYVNDKILPAHKDIDILCNDPKLFRFVSKAIPRQSKDDGIHYYIMVSNRKIELDIRWIGDGYYDSKWEQVMLNNRVSFSDMFYVMDRGNYYWSLLYHALIHKKDISNDYLERLSTMAIELNIRSENLDNYMRSHGYKYTYPTYYNGVVNFNNIDKSLIDRNLIRKYKYYSFRSLQKIKLIIKKNIKWEKK
jgi:hypothetical protein